MIQIKYVRMLLVLVLGSGFLFSVVFSIIKWRKGNTGLTHEIRRQDYRVLPTITLMRRHALRGNPSDNLTEEYLKIEPLDEQMLYIKHYNIEQSVDGISRTSSTFDSISIITKCCWKNRRVIVTSKFYPCKYQNYPRNITKDTKSNA